MLPKKSASLAQMTHLRKPSSGPVAPPFPGSVPGHPAGAPRGHHLQQQPGIPMPAGPPQQVNNNNSNIVVHPQTRGGPPADNVSLEALHDFGIML